MTTLLSFVKNIMIKMHMGFQISHVGMALHSSWSIRVTRVYVSLCMWQLTVTAFLWMCSAALWNNRDSVREMWRLLVSCFSEEAHASFQLPRLPCVLFSLLWENGCSTMISFIVLWCIACLVLVLCYVLHSVSYLLHQTLDYRFNTTDMDLGLKT